MTRFVQCLQCRQLIELVKGDSRRVVPCPHCPAEVPSTLLLDLLSAPPEPGRSSSTQIAAGEPPVIATEREAPFEPVCAQCGTPFSRLLRVCPACGKEWLALPLETTANPRRGQGQFWNRWETFGLLLGIFFLFPGLLLALLSGSPPDPGRAASAGFILYALLVVFLLVMGLRILNAGQGAAPGSCIPHLVRGLLMGLGLMIGLCAGVGILALAACSCTPPGRP